jgi:hypothetical protein
MCSVPGPVQISRRGVTGRDPDRGREAVAEAPGVLSFLGLQHFSWNSKPKRDKYTTASKYTNKFCCKTLQNLLKLRFYLATFT